MSSNMSVVCTRRPSALSSMAMTDCGEILLRLLRLPASERARLAAELIRSLDDSEDPDAAEAWLVELDRRVREVTSGAAELEPWAKVRQRIEARLRSR